MQQENIKNVQRNAFQLTINNPVEYGYTHEKIKETLIMNFTTLKYFCMADEIGGQGTYHTHIYVVFSSRVRWSKVKKNFGEALLKLPKALLNLMLNILRKQENGQKQTRQKQALKVLLRNGERFPHKEVKKPTWKNSMR